MREMILLVFLKKELFCIKEMYLKKKESKKESKKERSKKFFEYIENESNDIDYDLFEDYFDFSVPSALAKKLCETKNKNKNNELVELIKIRQNNLKDKTEKMSKEVLKNKKADKISKVIEEVLDFNQLEQQKGEGLKMLTLNQMLSRLPITAAITNYCNEKQEIIPKNFKTKLDNDCVLCTDQKNLQNNSIKAWLTLFKNENNLYEH